MKYARFLFLGFLIALVSCQNTIQIQTTLAPIAEPPVDEQTLLTLQAQIQKRLDRFGFSQTTTEIDEENGQLIVQAAVQADDPEAMRLYRSIFASASLELWDTYRTSDEALSEFLSALPPVPGFISFQSLPLGYYTPEVIGVCPAADSLQFVLDSLSRIPNKPADLKFIWSADNSAPTNEHLSAYRLYMIDTQGSSEAPVSDQHIEKAAAGANQQTGQPEVYFTLDETGTKIWGEMTQKAAGDENRSVAIVFNDRVFSVPRVMSPILNGRCSLTGKFTMNNAEEIAQKIQVGELIIPVEVVKEEIITEGE